MFSKYFQGHEADMAHLAGLSCCSLCGTRARCFSLEYASCPELSEAERSGLVGCAACLHVGADFVASSTDGDGRKLFLRMTDEYPELWDDSITQGESQPGAWHATYYAYRCAHCGTLRGNGMRLTGCPTLHRTPTAPRLAPSAVLFRVRLARLSGKPLDAE